MDQRRIPVAGVLFALLLAGAGCGSARTGTPATTQPPGPAPATSLQASESDNRTSATVQVGGRVTVSLHSSYWTIDAPVPAGVLATLSGPKFTPKPGGCLPGMGCGTVSMQFVAAGHGTATVSAHRESCGEAMRCPPSESTWQMAVRVP